WLAASEVDCRFYVERSFLPSDQGLVVLKPRVETKRQKAARGQFAAADMVQEIRCAMRQDERYVGRWPAVGPIKRGAQLPYRDTYGMALLKRTGRNCHHQG